VLITAFFEGSSLLNGCYDLFLFFFDSLLNPPDSAVCRVEVPVELLVQGRVLVKKVIKLLYVINFALISLHRFRDRDHGGTFFVKKVIKLLFLINFAFISLHRFSDRDHGGIFFHH
jgi:hypothetical protein